MTIAPISDSVFDAKSSGNGILSHGIRIKENAYSIDQSEKDWSIYCRHSIWWRRRESNPRPKAL